MSHPSRGGGAVFRPRFTLTILYFAGFFLLFCAGLAAPAMLEVWRSTAPGPAQQAASFDAVRASLGPQIPIALAAAFVTTAVGIAARVLPGLRRRT
jgi:hypothetical protein